MGFFSNPLKAHKKLAKAGLSATKSVAKAGVPKQSPAAGLLGRGGGGGMKNATIQTGGAAQATPAPGRGGMGARLAGAMRRDSMQGPGPRMAEGGKVKKKK